MARVHRTPSALGAQGAAQRGALASPAARLLNLGLLLAGLAHVAVLTPLLISACVGWGEGGRTLRALPLLASTRLRCRRFWAAYWQHPGLSRGIRRCTAEGPAGWVLPVNLSTWAFAVLTSAAGLAASLRLPLPHGAAPVQGAAPESKED